MEVAASLLWSASSTFLTHPPPFQASLSPYSILTPPHKRSSVKFPYWSHRKPSPDRRSPNPDATLSTDQHHKKAHCFQVYDQQAVAPPSPTTEKTQNKEKYDCVIVGAGISGLCTAQALATKHSGDVKSVLVTEARDRVGGNITTVQKGDYLWEEGPNSFQPSDPMLTMVVDTGLKDELVLGDPTAPRFVFWQGKLRPVPAGPTDLPFFDLMSIQGKLRAGLGALGLRPPPPGREESVEEFVRRNLGAEVFERLIEPFCSGVYAGNPAKLSMKAAFGRVWRLEEMGGSIIGGTFKLIQEKRNNFAPPRDPRLPKPKGQTVGSFRKGLTTLPKAIAEKLGSNIKLNWKLESIQRASGGGFELVYVTPEGMKLISTKSVLLTVPSYVASNILRPLSPRAADSLAKFYYPPVAAVTISYPKSAVREERLVDGELKGFGQLHPRSQGVETLGTIYSSSLFPGRAPADRVMLLNYIGGATNTEITSKDEAELVKQVDKDVRKMLIKPDAPSPEVLGVRVWPKAIPQFEVGHLDILDDARKALDSSGLEGLFLGGNYVVGVALGRCVEGAYESADSISEYFKKASVRV
ncbi:hypothetical protein GOP47_0017881 [Adiantum capillus-veneris]|uniref:Protoporphyrinogen oxidase n=1 Tax=Adiantum capillus-veneris TaxID=13818 RepID=A0A9D4UH40_ADICA|nr:hypothetical protein GOP47_0017881 [Adiantum capillus-veneris]